MDWNLIIELYRRNAGALSATPGVYLVPKLKRECVPYQLLQNVSGSRSTSKLSVHVICIIIKAFFTIIDRF